MPNRPSSRWDPGSSPVVQGIYYSSATTLTNGTGMGVNLDVNGNLKTTLSTLIAGEDLTNNVLKVEERFSYQALTSLVTVTVKSGAGFLHNIVVGGQSLPTINIWDNTAASTTLIGTINAASAPGTYSYDVAFTTGLTVQPLPGTAVLPNFTITYR